MFWTPERESLLRELWAAGRSAGLIAAQLGASRSAVMAKIERLDLPSRPTQFRAQAADVWTPEREKQLADMWLAGYSGSLIGKDLGCSRSAVIGKAFRMQLPTRTTTTQAQPMPRQRSTRPRPMLVRKRASNPVWMPAVVQFLALERGMCRYPMSDELWCGGTTSDGCSYCDHHARICYRPAVPRERRATY